MHTVLVKYVLPTPVPRNTLAERFKQSDQRFRNVPDLIRKYYCYDEVSGTGHSVYLWTDEAAARAFFSEEFLSSFAEKFGATPELTFVDKLIVVDNEQDKTVFG
jgi:uncharacterized protein (DUF2267 family)